MSTVLKITDKEAPPTTKVAGLVASVELAVASMDAVGVRAALIDWRARYIAASGGTMRVGRRREVAGPRCLLAIALAFADGPPRLERRSGHRSRRREPGTHLLKVRRSAA
ncbi:hypothetical protein GCM10023170_090470 [Phytohabitans houttuyneae]|uniref:Uncharacterized protein n=1 Tax=Phytohabitans houttuyneae TaxID=1076126 RepID=A0A6V8KIU9_9ACTN|nr:hypothetical protein Phou_062390 [Phytohabitans houttuyneae]